jgi:hypothetical protein
MAARIVMAERQPQSVIVDGDEGAAHAR